MSAFYSDLFEKHLEMGCHAEAAYSEGFARAAHRNRCGPEAKDAFLNFRHPAVKVYSIYLRT